MDAQSSPYPGVRFGYAVVHQLSRPTQKRLTDSLKRLLNLDRLNLWIDRTTTGEILDLGAAIKRIVYGYANPARARLAKRIDEFDGCNIWREFLAAAPDVDAFVEKQVPWIRAIDIEPLSSPNPSLGEERRVIEDLVQKAESRTHTLRIYPFKWLEPFGNTSQEEVEKIRQRIIRGVREEEALYVDKNFPPKRIESFLVTDEYRPPKKERAVFMYGSTREIRIQFLVAHYKFRDTCRNCYLLMRKGYKSIAWPPGCFIPPPPNLCNPLFA